MTLVARAPCGNSRASGVPSRSMTLIERDSVRPWPTVWSRCPGAWAQGSRVRARRSVGWLALTVKQVVRAAGVQVVGVGALAVQRVPGDHRSAQVGEAVEHRDKGSQLIPAEHRDLGERQVIRVVEDRD